MAQKVLNSLNVKDLTGKNGLVVYFFPKALSGPCSLEAHEFNERLDDFKKLGFNVVGVSLDKNEKNEKFSQREDLKFPLVSDTQHDATTKYSKVTRLKVAGIPLPLPKVSDRNSVILDPEGKVLFNTKSIGNKNQSIKESISILLDKLAELNKAVATKKAAVNKGVNKAAAKTTAKKPATKKTTTKKTTSSKTTK